MKAILVVDIPKEYIGSDIDINLYCKDGNVIHEKCVNKLKLMPEKKILDEELFMSGNFRLIQARFTGWNDCIDTITGETE